MRTEAVKIQDWLKEEYWCISNAEQCKPAATACTKKEPRPSTAFKLEYIGDNQKENCYANILMVDIFISSDDE